MVIRSRYNLGVEESCGARRSRRVPTYRTAGTREEGILLRFAFQDPADEPVWYGSFRRQLEHEFTDHGHLLTGPEDPDLGLVFHVVDPAAPHPFLRKHRATFSVGVVAVSGSTGDDLLKEVYPYLVRTISNGLVALDTGTPVHPWLITPELGCYRLGDGPGEQPYPALYQALAPMAMSRLVIDNRFLPDLPADLWAGTDETRELTWASRVVDDWGLLPSPFPIQNLLSAADWRYLKHLYGIGGLSYGNFSIRHDDSRFWMSASGVNKGNLVDIGRDILLVTNYDAEAEVMVLSVPPQVQPRRVSVDAVEHWMIYQRFPEIRAMMHLHAWVPDIPVTSFNYPCGTREVGEEMSGLLAREPDPGRAVIGLRNHGITATGPSFRDIISRLQGKVRPQVPMAAVGTHS